MCMAANLEYWLEQINAGELPALCTTVRQLERLAVDETASLSEVGQIILPDQGLTTRILQVVNTTCYRRGRNQITTISKAAIVLGYDTVKHICITARMIDSMLKHRTISKPLYQRVLQLFVQSFQAAMLARMLLDEHDEETREEAYIAALLQNLGEIAFWSLGGPQIEALDEALRQQPEKKQQLVQAVIGTSFQKLSAAVARNWNMGEVLIQSLESPDERTPELRTVKLANQYASNLISDSPDPRINAKLIKELASLSDIPEIRLDKKIQQCREETQALALSYGSSAICKQLKNAKAVSYDEALTQEPQESREILQLKLLRELSNLASENTDINSVIHTAMEGIYRGVGLERVLVLMLSKNRDQLMPRFLSCKQPEQDKLAFRIPVNKDNPLFEQAIRGYQPIWLKTHNDSRWRGKLSRQLLNLIPTTGCLLAPIICEQRCIGLFYADSQSPLSQDIFAGFNHFVQQNNLSLNAILMRRNGSHD